MNILDTLRERNARLVAKRDKLRVMLDGIEQEIGEIDTAIRVIERTAEKAAAAKGTASAGKPTVRDLIRSILKENAPTGLTVHDVMDRAQKSYRAEISQNTASVTLGRIKQDGQAKLEGRLWFYVDEETETADSPRNEPAAFCLSDAEEEG